MNLHNTMKNLFFAALAAIAFQSCDHVEVPQQTVEPTNPGDTTEVVLRKILVEDYTGHTCGNCPDAAGDLKSIQELYPGQVIAVAIHAGDFAKPSTAPFTADYRTATGNEYHDFFGFSFFPSGMVNRSNYPAGGHILSNDTWDDSVAAFVNDPPEIGIELTNTYDSNSKSLSVNVKTSFLSAMSGTYKLVVLLVEDSVISAQKDYSRVPSTIPDYAHRHMLRDAVNSTWGETIATGTINAGTLDTKNYIYNGLASNSWSAGHCYVVAYVYDAASYRVIQAEEKKVK